MKDPYLLAKALAYAIVAIEARPESIREQADYHDMVLLFRKLPATERELFLDEARRDLTDRCEHFGNFSGRPQRAETASVSDSEFPGAPPYSPAPFNRKPSPTLRKSAESD